MAVKQSWTVYVGCLKMNQECRFIMLVPLALKKLPFAETIVAPALNSFCIRCFAISEHRPLYTDAVIGAYFHTG